MTALDVGSHDATAVWRRSDDAVWRYTGDGVLLLSIGGGDAVSLDEAGAAVWQELACDGTAHQLSQRVAERVGAPVDEVTVGVTALLELLARERLTVRGDG